MEYPTINDIVNGANGVAEKRFPVIHDRAKTRELSDAHGTLLSALTQEQKEKLDKFMRVWEEAYLRDDDANCVEAFRLGLRLGIECMSN